ncbi:MAG: RNA methyltransferase [Opitutus sp.]|nr:RNA methyltransferase [Opitutus sp.]
MPLPAGHSGNPLNPRIVANQQRTLLGLLAQVLPHLERDSALPRRIKDLLGRHRAFGSRDRRLYRELIYTAIRYLPWVQPLLASDENRATQLIAWLAPELKETTGFRAALLADWPPTPPTLAEKSAVLRARFTAIRPIHPRAAGAGGAEAATPARAADAAPFESSALLPAWLRAECPAVFASPHLDALLARAPLWVRLQTQDHAMVLDEFKRRGWAARASAELPDAFALPPNAEVAGSDAYRRGFVEIQDLGSQLVLAHAPIATGQIWLDACAGAGGKTLQLAHGVGEIGRVDASDIRTGTLEELRDRAARARLANVRITHPGAAARSGYDGVLVDAPCSGTGTWRRLPHMKWFTKPETLAEFATLQRQILREQAPRVKPGGVLVYATCSLTRTENHEVAAAFLAQQSDFSAERPARDFGGVCDGLGTTLLPGTRDSDGFYVAIFRRTAAA